jgi:hypothetical protein
MLPDMKVSKFIFVGFFLAILILVGYGFYSKIKEKKAIFSINYHEEKELFVINTPSFFKKTGISVSLLQLKNSDIHYFEKPSADFFDNYPQLPSSFHKNWNIIKWKSTPYNNVDNQYIKIALSDNEDDLFLDEDVVPNLIQTLHFVRSLLDEQGNYYAILYKLNHNNKYSVTLYLVSPKRNLLVEINR